MATQFFFEWVATQVFWIIFTPKNLGGFMIQFEVRHILNQMGWLVSETPPKPVIFWAGRHLKISDWAGPWEEFHLESTWRNPC